MTRVMKTIRIGLCVLLSCMCLFLSVGYAAVSGSLAITGTASMSFEPVAIYIVDVYVSASSNVQPGTTPSVTKAGYHVFQHGNYTLKRQSGSDNPGGSVTVTVTVKNNTGVAQYFVNQSTTLPSNSSCVITYSGIKIGDTIAHGTTKTFTITFQNTNADYNGSLNLNQVETTLHFSPDFDESDTENATKSIAAVFQNVLAGKGPDGKGGSITYKGRTIRANQIMNVIMENMENVDTGGYIGNVGNATQDRKDLIAAVFGDNISMQIGNQHYSVSMLIKNQQIDGRGQNDMVLYVTADQLQIGGGDWRNNGWQDLNYVPVYGIIFIHNGQNGYDYCDHLFAGRAPVCDFAGDFGADFTGSFNTNLWDSTDYPGLTDTSNGVITQDYSTKDGELDEAYREYRD